MLVPVFHGLSPIDLVRPRRNETTFPFNVRDARYFYRARNAIYQLFLALMQRRRQLTVLMPDYNSGNEVMAIRAAGASIEYCPVGADMQLNPEEIDRLCDQHRPDVLYVIHYAGWPQPIARLVEICRRRNILLVEDCALALLSEIDEGPLGSFGDWAVFCLYKTLPLPNGAILVQNSNREPPIDPMRQRSAGAASTIGRTAELFVQRARLRTPVVGNAMSMLKRSAGWTATRCDIHRETVGDIGFDLSQVDLAMSGVAKRLLPRLNLAAIRRRRLENCRTLISALADKVALPLGTPGPRTCPLFLPVLAADKHAMVGALKDCGIEALEFWNDSCEPGGSEMSIDARFLREHVVEIPLHQDLTTHHMAYVAERLSQLEVRMSDASRRILAA